MLNLNQIELSAQKYAHTDTHSQRADNSPPGLNLSSKRPPESEISSTMPSKLRLQIHISLDGFMAGPDNAMDWLLPIEWTQAMKDYVNHTVMHSVVSKKSVLSSA